MLEPIKLLIYTDLNDTLLNRNYDFSAAKEALDVIREKQIPLIITTSKTRAQVEIYRKRLNINHPIIVENGSAVYFPKGSFQSGRLPEGSLAEDGEFVFPLAGKVEAILPDLRDAAQKVSAEIELISDMTADKIHEQTGMPPEECELAKDRKYIMYFLCRNRREELIGELRNRNFKITWGSYFMHVGDAGSKGTAVHKLTALYRGLGHISVMTAGFGDNMNDKSMFENVSYPYLVERPGGGYAEGIDVEGLERLKGVGPIGWNYGVLKLVKSIDWNDDEGF